MILAKRDRDWWLNSFVRGFLKEKVHYTYYNKDISYMLSLQVKLEWSSHKSYVF